MKRCNFGYLSDLEDSVWNKITDKTGTTLDIHDGIWDIEDTMFDHPQLFVDFTREDFIINENFV